MILCMHANTTHLNFVKIFIDIDKYSKILDFKYSVIYENLILRFVNENKLYHLITKLQIYY